MSQKQESTASKTVYREVDGELSGQRIDNYLLAFLKGVPRSHVYRLLRSGQVRVNSKRVSASYRIAEGDRVRIPPVKRVVRDAVNLRPEQLEWLEEKIIYEDDRILVVDKPSGLAVHGGSGIQAGCIESLRVLRPMLKSLELGHRLDRETSGCLIVAKKRSALRQLHEMLRAHQVKKFYFAVVSGAWAEKHRRVDKALTTRRTGGEARVHIDDNGKRAVSHFKVLKRFDHRATLVGVRIETGRTHQIRVHAAAMGNPIAGDTRYGSEAFNAETAQLGLRRMFLHSASISFNWAETESVFGISAPLPPELQRVLNKLDRVP